MSKKVVTLDIISDVMCPWCIVGYKNLQPALAEFSDRLDFEIKWQPFELNPNMPAQGQDLREHLHEKYGSTDEQSKQNRERLQNIGKDIGFEFKFEEDSRIYNTFNAHKLLHLADQLGEKSGDTKLQTNLKLALFETYFTKRKDVSNIDVLIEVATSQGISEQDAKAALESSELSSTIRETQQMWQQNGISAVPAVVVNRKYLLSGAQPTNAYQDMFTQLLNEA